MTDVTERRTGVTVLTPAELARRTWPPLHGDDRMENLVLWRAGAAVVGLLRLQPGAEDPGHVHPTATQHAWIIEGRLRVAGEEIGPGSYTCVPPGIAHPTLAVGPRPCTLLYVYHPSAPDHDDHQTVF